ncbi:MAG: prolyl oligopeptidase family serine peptidase [Nanoarchaeota archaeon]|nr:prolyl oligopeptidase family serine peptidase [Nanoarchaeota archaeon]
MRPVKFKTGVTPGQLGLEYENISFKTEDGITIKGWFIPAKKKTDKSVIVAHGYPFDKNNILGATYFLAEKYNLLLFDFRYFGESAGWYTTVGYNEKKDFLAAIDWLKKRNLTKTGAMGFSLGAATILMANSDDVKAIVSDSSYANIDMMIKRTYFIFPGITKLPFVWLTKLYARMLFGLSTKEVSPLNEISKIKAPVLLIHGDKDSQIPVENTKKLYEGSNKKNTELWIVPDADHGYALNLYPKEYEERIFNFFEKNIK